LGRNDPLDHQGPVVAMNDLAHGYLAKGQVELAIRQLEEAMRWVESRANIPSQYVYLFRQELIDAYLSSHRSDQAIPYLRVQVQELQKEFGELDKQTAKWQAVLGSSLLKQSEWVEAEMVLRASLTTRQMLEPEDWRTFNTRSMLGDALIGQKKFDEAEPLLLVGYKGMKDRQETIPQEGKFRLVEAAERLINLYQAWGNPDNAELWKAERATYPPEQAPPPRQIGREKSRGLNR
jgi:eukaryotic-like serine/threonine-protein kinase